MGYEGVAPLSGFCALGKRRRKHRSLAAATSKLASRVKNMGSCRSSFYARTLRGMDTGVDHSAFEPSLTSTAVEIQGGADTSSAVRHAAESVKSIAGSADEAIDAARCAPGVYPAAWGIGTIALQHICERLSALFARGRGIVVEARTAMHR